MPGPYTRAQMRTLVLRELQDPNGRYFTTALVNDVLNHVMGVFVEKTGLRRATTVIDVVAEDPTVDLSSVTPSVLKVLRVALPRAEGETDERKLIKVSEEELEGMDPDWRNTRGNPTHYMRWNQGHKALMLYPKPITAFSSAVLSGVVTSWDSVTGIIGDFDLIPGSFDSVSGAITSVSSLFGGLRVDYIAGSTDMDDDDDTPYTKSGVPSEHHYAIWRGAVGVCLKMETALKQLERAASYFAEFESEIESIRRDVKGDFQDKPIESVDYTEM